MPIAHEFKYLKAKSLKNAFALMEKHPNYQVLAGGTDLICAIKEGMISPEAVIDIKGLKGLSKIKLSNGELSIGSLVSYSEIIESRTIKSYFPLLKEAAEKVASCGIRNRATMVGNICSAVPCLDAGAPLMVYEATVVVEGKDGERLIPIKEWFVGPRKTSLKAGEIVKEVRIKEPALKHGIAYDKLSRYEGEDLAQATVAVYLDEQNNYRISFGSVAPVPVRASSIENLLNGKALSAELIAQAKILVAQEISPITDIRATKEFRLHMCEVMMERSLKRAQMMLGGK